MRCRLPRARPPALRERLRRSGAVLHARGGGAGFRPLCRGAPRGARDRSRLVAREPHLLRVAVPRGADHGAYGDKASGPNHILPTKGAAQTGTSRSERHGTNAPTPAPWLTPRRAELRTLLASSRGCGAGPGSGVAGAGDRGQNRGGERSTHQRTGGDTAYGGANRPGACRPRNTARRRQAASRRRCSLRRGCRLDRRRFTCRLLGNDRRRHEGRGQQTRDHSLCGHESIPFVVAIQSFASSRQP